MVQKPTRKMIETTNICGIRPRVLVEIASPASIETHTVDKEEKSVMFITDYLAYLSLTAH